ncbi:MAG: MBL fold metallo-hydrolase [candidate division WOR-3 bacterium]
MIRKKAVNAEFGSNCYLLGDMLSGDAILIDPSVGPEDIADISEGFDVLAIVVTHSHFDHILHLREAVALTHAPVMVGAGDAVGIQDPAVNLSIYLGRPVASDPPDRLLAEGDVISVGRWEFHVLETPGHSPGSITLVCPSAKVIITGDTLFAESIGRTDLPGGNEEELARSIRRIACLGDDFRVLPGHGPEAFIWEMKEINPFL